MTQILAVVSALAGLGCLAVGALGQGDGWASGATARPAPGGALPLSLAAPTPPTPQQSAPRSAGLPAYDSDLAASSSDRPTRPGAGLPVAIRIPVIDVSTPLVELGLQDDRTVEVPADPDRAGWYRFGATPGARGAAVVLGHLDSLAGPGVFAELSTLLPGGRVEVDLDTGGTVVFRVLEVRTYPNAQFPAVRVYRGDPTRRELNLVTCGGAYDPDKGGYQANVVVYTRRVPSSRLDGAQR